MEIAEMGTKEEEGGRGMTWGEGGGRGMTWGRVEGGEGPE